MTGGEGVQGDAAAGALSVCVVYSPAARQWVQVALCLPAGATVRDAVQASGLLTRFAGLDMRTHAVSCWGQKTLPDARLHAGDRIEICRPLRVDPKLARRERFHRQGARGAGLFAQRRPGGKPGY